MSQNGAEEAGDFRREQDLLGERSVPSVRLYGIHTVRAIENFPLSGQPVHPALIRAYAEVKLACARTNHALGLWADDPAKADAIFRACQELAEGEFLDDMVTDRLQGGAGTSLNMNVNEVIANRALQLLGEPHGAYHRVSPSEDINRHQSTNDTYPTALHLAAIRLLHGLEQRLVALQEAFQEKEKELAHVVKMGRTQLQDAVPVTLGREMGAYAEAFNRDRWRIYKCEERLRVVNLGGTAIGTGLAAPRQYIFRVTETLREITGIGFARAENLIEATQNHDVLVEVSGILRACASSLIKVCTDLRLLASGPDAGFGEIRLPERQAGSSMMPGKVNPVIPEAVTQAAMQVIGNDHALVLACSSGTLELNPFLPLAAACLLDNCTLLTNACDILRRHAVEGLAAHEDRCRAQVDSAVATLTALLPELGYDKATALAQRANASGKSIRALCIEEGLVDAARFDALLSPENVTRLGMPHAGDGSRP